MPEQPRNMPEQEHSIKARSHALFVDETPVVSAGATKPFDVYLRETPAHPLSPGIKAIFWVLGFIVAALFLAAIWRVSHRHTDRRPDDQPLAETAVLTRPGDAGPSAIRRRGDRPARTASDTAVPPVSSLSVLRRGATDREQG
jgi:hypothetical protein